MFNNCVNKLYRAVCFVFFFFVIINQFSCRYQTLALWSTTISATVDFSAVIILLSVGVGRTRGPSHVRSRGHKRQVDRRLRIVGRQPHHMGHSYGRRQTPAHRTPGSRYVRQTERWRVGGPVRIRRQAHNRVGHETGRCADVATAAPAHTGPVHVHGRDPGRCPLVRKPILADHSAYEHAGAVRQSPGVHQSRYATAVDYRPTDNGQRHFLSVTPSHTVGLFSLPDSVCSSHPN